jgi:hypothetical protein
LLDGLPLPGGDPADVDIGKLHQLIRHEDRTLSDAAEILGTTSDTVRYLLEVSPAPPAHARRSSYLTARAALPQDRLTDLYLRQQLSTNDIARIIGIAGIRGEVVARLARDYDIPLRKPGRHTTTSASQKAFP